MSSFHFTVDTAPMASEIHNVSKHVDATTAAVVAMKTAVIDAEQEAADHVCDNVNRGFFSLMHSQISQKIAQYTSTVEAKLMEMAQYAAALKGIQTRMQGDYNMISGRYTKLFRSINNNLQSRIAELDKPVFQLVDRDVRLVDNRMRLNSAQFAVNQLESVLSSQLLATSRVKSDASRALGVITDYVRNTALQTQKSNATMQDKKIDSVEEIYLPVSIVESTTPIGTPSLRYFVARSGNETIDRDIDASVREQSVNAILHGSWSEINPDDMANIEAEFTVLLAKSQDDPRVVGEIAKMFNRAGNVQRLNPDSHEL